MDLLSNEDHVQLSRYLGNDMTPDERTEFEKELKNNAFLRQALEFEKTLMQLGKSAGEKINQYFHIEEESRDEEIVAIIKEAGEKAKKGNLVVAQQNEAPGSRPLIAQKSLPEKRLSARFKKLNVRIGLAIAAAVTAIALTLTLYFVKVKNDSQVVANEKKTNSSQKVNDPDSSSNQNIIIPNQEQKDSINAVEQNKFRLTNAERNALFAANFQPDAIPADIPDVLQEPLTYYESAQYRDAISAFENIDPNFSTRGNDEDKKLTLFYTFYYKSLSYLANKTASKAIPELQKAIKESPDKFLTVKAKWNLALSYLKMGNLKNAEELLNELAENSRAREYRLKAKSLKDKLQKND